MDVTSLLNTAAAAAVSRQEAQIGGTMEPVNQSPSPSTIDDTTWPSPLETLSPGKPSSRRTSMSKSPSRNRTPWDANGYSLPLIVDTKLDQTSSRPILRSESPVESLSPKSPRHKFSNSHSSLSSYASSNTSFCHSRISSMSTVSGMPTMSTIPDVSSLEIEESDCSGSNTSRGTFADCANESKREFISSPPPAILEEPPTGSGRPGSPSDALLMPRGSQSLDRMSPQEITNTSISRSPFGHLVPPEFTKAHKRAISAPDFAALNSLDRTFPPLPATVQPTPITSHNGDRRSSFEMEVKSTSPVPEEALPKNDALICMYVDNCDTNSTLRKAISHIFGRNKLCTRMIPQHVWVHFCRKHYQRSRYRNAQEYAKLQCELVQKQVRRVQAWSDENKKNNKSGIVQDWSLSMRKRELTRVNEKKASRKRPYQNDSEDEDMDRAILNGTAVPDWLRSKCREGYSTEEIEEIVARLKSEMDQNNLTQIPDIEILPNMSSEDNDEAKAKAILKRKTSAGSTHRRSQSVNLESDSSMSRRTSHASSWKSDEFTYMSPVEKRQRISDSAPYYDHQGTMGMHRLANPQMSTLPVAMRPMHHLPHRPAFRHIQENHVEEAYFEDDGRGPHYQLGGGPLPAPTPQRYGSQPMAAHLESNTSHAYNNDARRPAHQRAHSEFGGFVQNANFTFRSVPPADYGPMHPTYSTEALSYGRPYAHTEPTMTPSAPPAYYDESAVPPLRVPEPSMHRPNDWLSPPTVSTSAYTGPRHVRHQSTPNVPHSSIPRISPSDHHGFQMNASYGSTAPYHQRQQSYAPMRTQSHHRSTIPETEQGKAFYSERH